MFVLFDHGTPRGLVPVLIGHKVVTAYSLGWERLNNGALLKAAEEAEFDIFLTTDRRIQYQQNLTDRKIGIVVLTGNTKWSRVRMHLKQISAAMDSASPGCYIEVEISFGRPYH